MESIKQLQEMIAKSESIVFLGGAGVSTESGIPDFRSEAGIFKAIQEYGYPPETLLSNDFFMQNPETFYAYYKKYLLYPNARPNAAHQALAKLEQQGKLKAVVTQNIDDLHQRAGSKNVLELHGSVYRYYCMRCHETYAMETILESGGIPRCSCGGIIRPDVVLYGEGLDQEIWQQSVYHIRNCDMLIIGGTSLMVYPAAGLIDDFRGKHLVLINKSETSRDAYCNLRIYKGIGEVLEQVI